MDKIILIAGPCVIESRERTFRIAKSIKEIVEPYEVDFYFKSSFDKANRTSIESFRGLGLEEGLEILCDIRDELGLKVITDVHECWQVEHVAKVCDAIQIPAFLSRQTDLVVAAANTGKLVNVKKSQIMSSNDCEHIINKIKSTSNRNYMICERGTAFGYDRLVVDLKETVKMLQDGHRVCFDATHSTQVRNQSITDGESYMTPYLTYAAASVGVRAFFFEVSDNPSTALSDKGSMIDLQSFEETIKKTMKFCTLAEEIYADNT